MDDNQKFAHLGMPVRGLEKILEAYKKQGFTELIRKFTIDSSDYEEYLVYGKTPDSVVITKAAFCKIGTILLNCCNRFRGIRCANSF